MANPRKTLAIMVAASGWLSSVLPTTWAAMISAAGATVLIWIVAGAKFFTSSAVLGTLTTVVLVRWTYVALVWLATRRPFDKRLLRYGVTFEGVFPVFTPWNKEATLGFGIQLRNFSPVPLRYIVEEIEVYLETRTLPSRFGKDSLQSTLPRGAVRMSNPVPFRYDHVHEFFENG